MKPTLWIRLLLTTVLVVAAAGLMFLYFDDDSDDIFAESLDTSRLCELPALIHCERQVAIASIPVTGTGLDLHYASDRVVGRTNDSFWDARDYGLGGWMLSIHHRYDVERHVLDLGSGERFYVGPP